MMRLSSNQVEQLAADWMARRDNGLSAVEQTELARWLEEPTHRVAFAELERASALLREPRATGRAPQVWHAVERTMRKRRRRRALLAGAGSVALVAMLFAAVAAFRPAVSEPVNNPPSSSTIALRPDRQRLPDGSFAELNAGAEIEVSYTSQARTVRLLKGEVLFEVAKDPVHPFVVDAGDVTFRAVGTAFAVRRQPHEIGLLVTEGTVAVEHTTETKVSAAAPMLVSAGGQLTLSAAGGIALPQQMDAAQVATELAWRKDRIEFNDTPLPQAIEILNARNRVRISLGDSSLSTRSVTGTFWANDAEGFSHLLEKVLDLKTERQGDEIVLRPASR